MAKYRSRLPQMGDATFLTDGGMETTLIFHQGQDLPHFASFVLLSDPEGVAQLERYYLPYLALAAERGLGFIIDTPTWRANPDWGEKLGYGPEALRAVNQDAVLLALELRRRFESATTPCVISGAIGPRGDGYKAGIATVAEAEGYHAAQIVAFAESEADMVAAYTLTSVEEATGIALAAKAAHMPCVISFTLETDGKLVTGRTLEDAIRSVDEATGGSPAYYMINCAHPTHFADVVEQDAPWLERIRGLRANSSAKSHAELDESTTLDEGDPLDLGQRYRELGRHLRSMRVLGGCCGTDHRHVAAICAAVAGS